MNPRLVILCVDDEEIILNSLQEELAATFAEEYDLEFAISAHDALDMIEEIQEEDDVQLAVVISDYIMPKMTGDDFLIRVHEKFPVVKKIMLTGQSRIDGVSKAINEGNLYQYLEKPWDSKDMASIIQKAIRAYENEKRLHESRKRLLEIQQTLAQQEKEEEHTERQPQSKIVQFANGPAIRDIEYHLNQLAQHITEMLHLKEDITHLWDVYHKLNQATTIQEKETIISSAFENLEANPLPDAFQTHLQKIQTSMQSAQDIIRSLHT